MPGRKGLGAEHPLNDNLQIVFVIVYLVVWGVDSFVFRFSTVLAGMVSVFVRVFLGIVGILALAAGVYLVRKAESAVFVKGDEKSKLITTGVYGRVRHPMYLGSLLILLLFFFATLSLLSLLVWFGFFVFLDRMATYEERDLIKILNGQYVDYQKQVPKWLINIRHGAIRNMYARNFALLSLFNIFFVYVLFEFRKSDNGCVNNAV